MFRIRRVNTKSGSTAVQVVLYQGHLSKIISHIGSGSTREELNTLVKKARAYISERSNQLELFAEPGGKVLFVDKAECIGVSHAFSYRFLRACIKECELDQVSRLLTDFAIIRLIEPASKLRSIWLLEKYFEQRYSQRIYRKIPKLISEKNAVQEAALQCAIKKFGEDCHLILYDVTTLYFESHKEDDLKIPGFSKDDKSKQPQIVVGLLVSRNGFPLAYEVFPGNTFEGKTMLPLLDEFLKRHESSKPIVVADAAMLSEKNIEELNNRKISYIVAARLANTSRQFIDQISSTLNRQNGAICRFPTKHGDVVCNFSAARFRKQFRELNESIKKANEILAGTKSEKRSKFIIAKSKKLALNTELIEKSEQLLGIKGYCTNIPEKELSSQQIIDRYGDLWRIEKAFRMSKADLQTRPIFHRQEHAIRSHVLICFTALIIQKYLETKTGMSLRRIRDELMAITEAQVLDKHTNKVHVIRPSTDLIMKTPLGSLIKNWALPH